MYVSIYIHKYAHIYVFTYIWDSIYMESVMSLSWKGIVAEIENRLVSGLYIYTYLYTFIYIYIYIYVYTLIYICIFVYKYIYIHTGSSWGHCDSEGHCSRDRKLLRRRGVQRFEGGRFSKVSSTPHLFCKIFCSKDFYLCTFDLKVDVSQKSFEQKTCGARHHIFFCKITTQLTCVLIVASMKRHKKAGRFLRANCCVGLKCTGAFRMGCSRCVCVCL